MLFLRLLFTLVVAATLFGGPAPADADTVVRASFAGEAASGAAHRIADWTVATGDNRDLPFIIVDKIAARLFLFDRNGALRASTAVLLGSARGDVSPAGVGDKPLAAIRPDERITPAGRFVADTGVNLAGRDIIWVDYGAAIAIHRATDVTPGGTARDRLRRLAGMSSADRRISLGCINVPDAFYEAFVRPTFARSSGIVYILPESAPLAAIFAVQDPVSG